MYKQQLLFWYSLFDDLVNIYTVFVAVILYLEVEQSYFTMFATFISAKKLYSLIGVFRYQENFLFYIFDFFQLGFVYIFFADNFKRQEEFIQIKVQWIIVQLFVEFLYFFCGDILQNNSVKSYVKIASLLNFILFTLLLVATISFSQIEEQNYLGNTKQTAKILFRQLIITLSYYLTICAFTFYKDDFGINLGYYQIILIISNYFLLTVIYCFNNKILKYYKLLGLILYSVFFNIDYSTKNIDFGELETIFASNFIYLNQLMRAALLVYYSHQNIPEYLSQSQNLLNQTKLIFILASLFLCLIYFLINFKDFINCQFRQKCFNVSSQKELEKINRKLNKKQSLTKIYWIYLLPDKEDNIQEPILKEHDQQKILQFWQAVSFQLRFNKLVNIKQSQNNYMKIVNVEILIEIENIHSELLYLLEKRIKNLKNIDHLIMKRIENGFIDNIYTNNLLERKNIQDRNNLIKIISNILSINAYYKNISNLMIYKPIEILYDLYDI